MAIEEEDDAGGIPEWVVTFGDMMSLLLTFFIMLVSLSEIKEEEQYQAMVESFRQQFGYDSSTMSLAPGKSRPRNSPVSKLATQGRANRFDTMRGGDRVQAPVGDSPRVRVVRPGARTAVGTVVQFEEDSIELSEANVADLRLQAEQMRGKPQKIEIRGHTSLRPRANGDEHGDNWQLAYARSRAVMRCLVEELGLDERRVRLTVAGANEPMHVGSDPTLLKLNPRVEVYMLDEIVADFVGSPDDHDNRYIETQPP